MLIEKLIVRKTKPSYEVIREIPFNLKGLSLIVETQVTRLRIVEIMSARQQSLK